MQTERERANSHLHESQTRARETSIWEGIMLEEKKKRAAPVENVKMQLRVSREKQIQNIQLDFIL